MMQPSEFIKALEQKVRIQPHCTARMRDFLVATKEGKFDISVEAINEMDRAAKLPSDAQIKAAQITLAQVVEKAKEPVIPKAVNKVAKAEGE